MDGRSHLKSKTPPAAPGNFVRIRILDVDGEQDYILAEMVTAGAKPRRTPARRAEISAAEQTCQLRELAEDAARQSGRVLHGITSLTEEEEAQDKALSAERRGEAQPDAIIIAEGAVQRATAEGDGHRKRRRRRRGGRGRERIEETTSAPIASAPATNAPAPAEAAAARAMVRRSIAGAGSAAAAAGGRGGLGPSGARCRIVTSSK